MHIPLAFGLVGSDGKDIDYGHVDGAAVENGVIHVRKRRHVVRFSDVAERPSLSLNRGFSAPITLSASSRRRTSAPSWRATTATRSRAGRHSTRCSPTR